MLCCPETKRLGGTGDHEEHSDGLLNVGHVSGRCEIGEAIERCRSTSSAGVAGVPWYLVRTSRYIVMHVAEVALDL